MRGRPGGRRADAMRVRARTRGARSGGAVAAGRLAESAGRAKGPRLRPRREQPTSAAPGRASWTGSKCSRTSSTRTSPAKTPPIGSILKLVSPPAGGSSVENWAPRFEPLIGVRIVTQGEVRTRIKTALSAFPDRYALPSRPATAQPTVQDAFRQTQFLLSGDLDLFEKMMNLQLQIVKANSRLRIPEAGALFSFWSRAFSHMADACTMMTLGSYTATPAVSARRLRLRRDSAVALDRRFRRVRVLARKRRLAGPRARRDGIRPRPISSRVGTCGGRETGQLVQAAR